MKKLLTIVLILVMILVVAVLAGFFYIDVVAKTAVEKGGRFALGVPTSLETADVKPLGGAFRMNGLTVANPDGYDTSHFLALKDGDMAVALGTLMSDTVRLPHLKLSGIDMNMEKKDGKANYQVILDNLKKLTPEQPDPNAKKFVIETVEISDIMVHVKMLGQNISLPIDTITLKNVGEGGAGGVDLAELIGVVMKGVFAAITQVGGNLIPSEMLGDLTQGLAGLANLDKLGEVANVKAVGELAGKAGELAGEAGKAAGEAIGGAKEAADDIANKAKQGLGGLLGGDKKDGGN